MTKRRTKSGAKRACATRLMTATATAMTMTACALGACGGDGPTGSSDAAAGSGGGGQATGATTSAATSSTTGSGGGGAKCLDEAAFAALVDVRTDAYCPVEVHAASEEFAYNAPTWGSHDGPLSVGPAPADAPLESVALRRWKATEGDPLSPLTPTEASFGLGAAAQPEGTFFGAPVDLPFFGWTVIPATTLDGAGTLIAMKDLAAVDRYEATGIFALGGLTNGAAGRLVFSALSPLGGAAGAVGPNGLYAADACPTSDGLGTTADGACATSRLVDAWGEASGPVAVDAHGNVFAVMVNFSDGTQQGRAFAKADVAPGAGAAAGQPVFTVEGYGSALAAIAPSEGRAGHVFFAPIAGAQQPVLMRGYREEEGGLALEGGEQAGELAAPKASDAGFTLMVDRADRVWLGVSTPGSGETTFVVFARRD